MIILNSIESATGVAKVIAACAVCFAGGVFAENYRVKASLIEALPFMAESYDQSVFPLSEWGAFISAQMDGR